MRTLILRDCSGFSFVILMMMVPAIVAGISAVIVIGQISIAKMRLQIAVDRGAYAGAMTLARSLNDIASANSMIRRAFESIRGDFENDMQQSESAARERIDEYQAEVALEFQKISEILEQAPEKARFHALSVAIANAPESEIQISMDSNFIISDRAVPDLQQFTLGYDFVEGSNFADPDDVGHGSFKALSHLIKERRFDGWVAMAASQRVVPLSLANSYGGDFALVAVGAAKAYGGSLEKYALSAGRIPSSISEGVPPDNLYRGAMIPFQLLSGETR